ncbi:MAG: adenylate kinase family protein [Acidimicrobiales bacterium]
MKLILLGVPGSGKGTQGRLLAEHFRATHISSGELLRAHLTDLTGSGTGVGEYVRAGELVPDEVVLSLLHEPVMAALERGGYILDGFPRTLAQAELATEHALGLGATPDAVAYLEIPDATVRRRLLGRSAEGRLDDSDAAVIERRLQIFHEATQPLLGYYSDRGLLVTVDASGTPEEVEARTLAALKARL